MQSGGVFGYGEAIGSAIGSLAGSLFLVICFFRWEGKRYNKREEQENRSWDDDHPYTQPNALAVAAAAARAAARVAAAVAVARAGR